MKRSNEKEREREKDLIKTLGYFVLCLVGDFFMEKSSLYKKYIKWVTTS